MKNADILFNIKSRYKYYLTQSVEVFRTYKKAPLNILLVANTALLAGKDDADNLNTAYIDAGFIAQNAYLYCASAGLNCVVRLMIDRDEIRKTLGFDKKMYPVAGLTVGY